MTKKAWYADAGYTYFSTPDKDGMTHIQFLFPNAATGSLAFQTWLYKFRDGEIVTKNLEAEMLQCYIDRDLRGSHD